MATGKQRVDRPIGVDDAPVIVQEQRRIRFVRAEQVTQTWP